ncbi:hypothetical protein PybrP1_012812 [[Pythium] brassicae (nom. inval.)]|nr:hypothetical protein PybrP1_012812 [[Pythium] brassicae (nom. inval.)]
MQTEADCPSRVLLHTSLAQHDTEVLENIEAREKPAGGDERVARFPEPAWVGTQLRVVAVAGLAAAHLEPFVRVLFRLPSRRKPKAASRHPRVVSLDNEGVSCRRRRDPSGRYTAIWETRVSNASSVSDDARDDGDAFALPPELEYVEVQVWNRFPTGYDVFLGTATVAIKSVWRQLLSERRASDALPLSTATLEAPRVWFSLLPSPQSHTGDAAAQRLQLSVQLDVRFTSDPRAFAIRQKIARSTVAEGLKHGGALGPRQSDATQPTQRVADPVFAFTKPFQAIDWSVVVSMSLRHVFFHADVDRLSSFKHQVLYGDLLRELHDDDGLHVNDAHVAAFQLCQLSAQYLDHCVSTLAARSEEYSDQFQVLADTRRQLHASRSRLKRQRDRLKNESDELDLLLSTYRSIANQSGVAAALQDDEALENAALYSPHGPTAPRLCPASVSSNRHDQALPPASPSPDKVISQKPAFLRTWEERERERRLEKERSKARRIAEEKKRLEQLAEDRRQRQQQEQTLASAALALDQPLETGSLVKQEVGLLVSTWRRLRRIFILARTAASSLEDNDRRECRGYETMFAKLDARHDGVLDRAELRVGVRSFGVRVDRKLTRMPLHISLAQFVQGFDLPCGSEKRRAASLDSRSENVSTTRSSRKDRVQSTSESKVDARDSSDDDTKDAETPDSVVDDPIAVVAGAVAAMRQWIVEAATLHLEAHGASPANYRAFRDALAIVFQEFDADGNGELDMAELVACVRSIGLELSSENLALVRDCFGCEGSDSDGDRIRIADFVSFALARAGEDDGTESLGLVGSHLREAVLQRVRATQQEAESADDAVRRLFRRAFPSKSRRSCPVARFTKALSGLQLGVKPAQLARLVMRLDKDNDGSISFDELLLWLRLRNASELTAVSLPPVSDTVIDDDPTQHRLAQALTARQSLYRAQPLLYRLAGVDPNTAAPTSSSALAWRAPLLRLFREIDRNDSKEITTDEIESFLVSRDLAELCPQIGESGAGLSPRSWAKVVGDTIDADRNGVVTLDEWMAFLDPSQQPQGGRSGHLTRSLAMVNSVRVALLAAAKDDAALFAWFHGLPGALPVATTTPSTTTTTDADARELHPPAKVRVGVFKSALRAKLGASTVPPLAVDEAVKRLDRDHSGWVTTAELRAWAFPPRDLEALMHIVAERWRHEEEQAGPDFALALYRRFDADGNGVLAQRELRGGFASFGLLVTADEAVALLQAFDLDRDGCWSKAEFLAFVYTLLPQAIFRTTTSARAGSVDGGAEGEERTSRAGDEEYASDGFLSSRSSSSAASGGPSEREAPPSSAEQDGAEYSEDFG